MGQSKPFHRKTALVVECDAARRELLALLLEESGLEVIHCDHGEMAMRMLETQSGALALLFTAVDLTGRMDGIELAYRARARWPDLNIVVSSGESPPRRLPDGTLVLSRSWRPLDVLREAERLAQ